MVRLPWDLVKNNFPKSLSSVVKPFVLSLSKHDRLDAGGRNFSVHPSTSSGRTEKFYSIHIGKLLMTVSLMNAKHCKWCAMRTLHGFTFTQGFVHYFKRK
jgi:hypothetical protein